MVDKSDMSYLDPDQVRKVELCHQPPSRESVRVTVEYVSSEVRVLTVTSHCLRACLRTSTPQRGKPSAGAATFGNSQQAKFVELWLG